MAIPDVNYDTGNEWQQMEWRVVGTRVFGEEFAELFHIIEAFQRSRKKKVHIMTYLVFNH